jgi:hypothetical protein
MQKAQVKNTEQLIKETAQLAQKETPECNIKKLKTLGLLLGCLHEIVRVCFESCMKVCVKMYLQEVG